MLVVQFLALPALNYRLWATLSNSSLRYLAHCLFGETPGSIAANLEGYTQLNSLFPPLYSFIFHSHIQGSCSCFLMLCLVYCIWFEKLAAGSFVTSWHRFCAAVLSFALWKTSFQDLRVGCWMATFLNEGSKKSSESLSSHYNKFLLLVSQVWHSEAEAKCLLLQQISTARALHLI